MNSNAGNSSTSVNIQKTTTYQFSFAKLLLTSCFIAVNMTYFTMAPRILQIFNLIEPGGILVFPLTFFLSDVITEVYGYRYIRSLIWCILIALGIFTFFGWLSMQVPSSSLLADPFPAIFIKYPRLYLGVSIATFVSFFANNAILAKLKIIARGKIFWLRSLFSTSIGHLTFSAIWVLIYHWNNLTSWHLFYLVACMYAWKMGFEITATPAAWALASYLKRKEGMDVYDIHTNFNPFRFI